VSCYEEQRGQCKVVRQAIVDPCLLEWCEVSDTGVCVFVAGLPGFQDSDQREPAD